MNTALTIDWYLLFIVLGIAQAMFLSILIFIRRKSNGQHFVFFSLFMFSLAIILTEVFLNYSGYIVKMIHVSKVSLPFQFLIGPSLFLFMQISLSGKRPIRIWKHFGVFLFILLYFLLFYFQDAEIKQKIHELEYNPDHSTGLAQIDLSNDPLGIHPLIHFLVFAHLLLYAFLIGREISRKYKEMELPFFSRKPSYINHYRNLLLYYTTAIVFMAFLVFRYFYLGDYIFSLYLSGVIYIISINISTKSLGKYFFHHPKEKYKSSALSDDDKQLILERIKSVVEDESFYCQTNASLEGITQRIKVPRHYVSQVINEKLGKSLFQCLAENRISKSKDLLADPKYHNLTIDEISFMVGYNSRSAFNRVFKSITGKTPVEYKKG